jgi:hypothetical protein
MTRRLGYRDLGEVDLWVRVERPGALARAALPGWAQAPGAAAIAILKPFLFRRREPQGAWEIEEIETYGRDFDDLYAAFRRRYGVMVRRDAAHLNWRYTGFPIRRYRAWVARREGRLAAYAIFRPTTFRDVPSGMLMDLAGAGPDALDAELAVLDRGVASLAAEGAAAFFAFLVPGVEEAQVLRRAGFRLPPEQLKPQPFPLLVLPSVAESEVGPTLDLKNWYFTIGDYDVF